MGNPLNDSLAAPLRHAHPMHLDDLALPAPLRIAVLAPHPDDFDAIGISMRRLLARGHRIALAVLTSGSNGVENGFGGACTPAEKAALREAEQLAACARLGLPAAHIDFLRLWQRGDDDADDVRLRAWLHAQRTQLAFMPHGNDRNATHRRVHDTVRRIAEADRLDVWCCLNRDAKTVSMRTDLYSCFDDEEARWKAQLLRLHASQQSRNLHLRGEGFDDRVLRVNRTHACGRHADHRYAETFELRHYG